MDLLIYLFLGSIQFENSKNAFDVLFVHYSIEGDWKFCVLAPNCWEIYLLIVDFNSCCFLVSNSMLGILS